MSFKDRISSINENLTKQVHGDDAEAASLRVGNSNGFYSRLQGKHPSPVMVKPKNATWDYNPVDVLPDTNHGEVGGVRIADDYKSPSEQINVTIREMVESVSADVEALHKAIFN